jgi:hypothetical protein
MSSRVAERPLYDGHFKDSWADPGKTERTGDLGRPGPVAARNGRGQSYEQRPAPYREASVPTSYSLRTAAKWVS